MTNPPKQDDDNSAAAQPPPLSTPMKFILAGSCLVLLIAVVVCVVLGVNPLASSGAGPLERPDRSRDDTVINDAQRLIDGWEAGETRNEALAARAVGMINAEYVSSEPADYGNTTHITMRLINQTDQDIEWARLSWDIVDLEGYVYPGTIGGSYDLDAPIPTGSSIEIDPKYSSIDSDALHALATGNARIVVVAKEVQFDEEHFSNLQSVGTPRYRQE